MQGIVPGAEGQPSLPPTRKLAHTPHFGGQDGLPGPATVQRPEQLTPPSLDAAIVFPAQPASSAALDMGSWDNSGSGSSVVRVAAHPNREEVPDGIVELPEIGRSFLGFQLLAELGRGT